MLPVRVLFSYFLMLWHQSVYVLNPKKGKISFDINFLCYTFSTFSHIISSRLNRSVHNTFCIIYSTQFAAQKASLFTRISFILSLFLHSKCSRVFQLCLHTNLYTPPCIVCGVYAAGIHKKQ